MKFLRILVACALAATFSAQKASAQDTLVLKVLEENAPKYFNAPGMPRFSVIGNQREFYLGIGGYIRGSMSFDWGNPIESPLYFITSAIPMDNAAGNSSLFQMSAASSNMFFNFVALPHTENKVGAYVDFGFAEGLGNYGFSVKAAYLTYRNFVVGYTTSLFTDGQAAAQTIDQQGPNAMTFLFNTVVDYQCKLNDHWKIGAGLEMPSVNATYGSKNEAVNQRIPDIPLYVQYSWKQGKGWIRLSGLFRDMQYHNLASRETSSQAGMAVKLSSVGPLSDRLTLYSQSVFGSGIASYVQDLQGLGLDMVPVDGASGKMRPVEVVGSYLGLQYQISPVLSTSATFSEVKCFMPDGFKNDGTIMTASNGDNTWGGTYKEACYLVCNVIYKVSPVLTTGLEYLWGSRKDLDDVVRHNNRLQASLRVNF